MENSSLRFLTQWFSLPVDANDRTYLKRTFLNVVIRGDEKAGLPEDAIRSQLRKIKETGDGKIRTVVIDRIEIFKDQKPTIGLDPGVYELLRNAHKAVRAMA